MGVALQGFTLPLHTVLLQLAVRESVVAAMIRSPEQLLTVSSGADHDPAMHAQASKSLSRRSSSEWQGPLCSVVACDRLLFVTTSAHYCWNPKG